MRDHRIPLYLITGFLESGKTTLLLDTLGMDYFNDGQRTLLIRCEDGEEEYPSDQLSQCNCILIPIETPQELTTAHLEELERHYQPERVLMEYNGMWPIQLLRELKLPKRWGLYQAIHVIDATTFELYRANMQSKLMDMVLDADMVLFNRCVEDMPLSTWKRSIQAVNRRCEIAFEDPQGKALTVETIPPYPLDQPHFTLAFEDYGIWYLDIQDHPQRYLGKEITFTAQVMLSKKFPKGTFIPGRNAMTCCPDDIRFFGFLCRNPLSLPLKHGQWIKLRAQIQWEADPAYDGEGVVLYAKEIQPTTISGDPLIYFR